MAQDNKHPVAHTLLFLCMTAVELRRMLNDQAARLSEGAANTLRQTADQMRAGSARIGAGLTEHRVNLPRRSLLLRVRAVNCSICFSAASSAASAMPALEFDRQRKQARDRVVFLVRYAGCQTPTLGAFDGIFRRSYAERHSVILPFPSSRPPSIVPGFTFFVIYHGRKANCVYG
jgi:hypothetical protein